MRIGSIYQRHKCEIPSKESSTSGSDIDDDDDDDNESIENDIIRRMDVLERDGTYGDDEDESTEIGKFDNKYITKLIKNYRSHPHILLVRVCQLQFILLLFLT